MDTIRSLLEASEIYGSIGKAAVVWQAKEGQTDRGRGAANHAGDAIRDESEPARRLVPRPALGFRQGRRRRRETACRSGIRPVRPFSQGDPLRAGHRRSQRLHGQDRRRADGGQLRHPARRAHRRAGAVRLSDDSLVDAMFMAAAIGRVIALQATISGAEGGCQAECGTAAAMAAAAFVQLDERHATSRPSAPAASC